MKCDVCGTKIPLGTYECPNCGFRYKIENTQNFDVKSSTHEHIKTSSQSYTRLNAKRSKSLNQKNAIIIVSTIFISIIMMMILIGVAVSIFSDLSDGTYLNNDFEDMTFQEVIDEGYDDGTVEMTKKHGEDLKEFMIDTLGTNQLYVDEYCSQYDDTINASVSIEGSKDDIMYQMRVSYYAGKISNTEMKISGDAKKSIIEYENIPIHKEIVNQMGNYIDVSDAYERLNTARFQMVKDTETKDRKFYLSESLPYVYISESYYNLEYGYYCSISQEYSR